MKIKGADGYEHSVTSQGQGALNTVLGGLGTASFFGVNAGNVLNGFGRNGNCAPMEAPVSRYDLGMAQELGAKDSKIALLEAQIYTDQQTDKKIGEAITFVRGEMKELAAEVRANKNAQDAINMQQAVYNGVNTATIECVKNQVAQLMGLTKLIVPNGSICPGWGNVTVTPATTTPTTGA